ncbi:MAG: hypothetical protein IJD59_08125, partial [Clostridia bacterium]|nr:hypothetical protein [Clostridia bacterium]
MSRKWEKASGATAFTFFTMIFHIRKSYNKKCFCAVNRRAFLQNISLLQRGNGQLFLCLKEKVAKRSKQTCRLIAGAYGNCIPQSPLALRESVPMAHVSLDERDFAARGSLG